VLTFALSAVVACGGTNSTPGLLRNATTTARSARDLCDSLDRVIQNASTSFIALRGAPLPYPSQIDPTDPTDGHWASTIAFAGATTTILKHSWSRWMVEFHDPGDAYEELKRVVFGCAAVAGWPPDEASDVPAVTLGATTVFVDDAHNPGDGPTIQVLHHAW
jgi:hypothetical protein